MDIVVHSEPITIENRSEWEYIWKIYHEWHTARWINTLWQRLEQFEKIWGVFGLLVRCNDQAIWILHMQIKWWTFWEKPSLYVEDLCLNYPRNLLRNLQEADFDKEIFKKCVRKALVDGITHISLLVKNILWGVEIEKIEFDTDEANIVAQKMYREMAWDGYRRDGRVHYTFYLGKNTQ